MPVEQTNVLNVKSAREQKDERHLCPLQLDVIHRAVVMWSNAGDTVLSAFMGIGSEGYVSLKLGRLVRWRRVEGVVLAAVMRELARARGAG